MSTELSPVETAKLENLEIVIENGIKSFLEVGRALLQIRDERLYRLTHDTFDAYCHERWNMSRSYANRMATAAATIDLLPIGDIQPTSESQVRPLAKLPVEQRAEAWQEAVEVSHGKPTAAVVAAVVARQTAKVVDVDLTIGDVQVLGDDSFTIDRTTAATPDTCPSCGGSDFDSDDMGWFCTACKDGDVAQKPEQIKRIGVGVIFANEAINTLQKIPKRDKLRKRAWQIVRDWMEANR